MMADQAFATCPTCNGERLVAHPFLQGAYAGSHAIEPPEAVTVECESCGGTGEICADDHDIFKYPHGTEVKFRGEKRVVFYEHEGDHVIIWWFPGDEATNGPPDATPDEQSAIYEQLWAKLESWWSWEPEQ